MRQFHSRGFTIVELLVVVSIIALLIGVLLPAIVKARDRAKVTQSQSNLRNLGIAHAAYASAFNDRQLTFINDNISQFCLNVNGIANNEMAFSKFKAFNGRSHPRLIYGTDSSGTVWDCGNSFYLCEPIAFPDSFWRGAAGMGSCQYYNSNQFNQFLGGRFYDPVCVVPKDRVVLNTVEDFMFEEAGFDGDKIGQCVTYGCNSFSLNRPPATSYCLSPAAMFSPEVFKVQGWRSPWVLAGGFRSPPMSAARYPDLKTHMLEHHWLQNARAAINPSLDSSVRERLYAGGEPYYFNHSIESVPMTFFYDGHVGELGAREAMKADGRVRAQTGNDYGGLWKRTTPFHKLGGYYGDYAFDDLVDTSYHILTMHGIRGRDTLAN